VIHARPGKQHDLAYPFLVHSIRDTLVAIGKTVHTDVSQANGIKQIWAFYAEKMKNKIKKLNKNR